MSVVSYHAIECSCFSVISWVADVQAFKNIERDSSAGQCERDMGLTILKQPLHLGHGARLSPRESLPVQRPRNNALEVRRRVGGREPCARRIERMGRVRHPKLLSVDGDEDEG